MKKKILSLIMVLFVVGGGYEVIPKVINPFQTTVYAATVKTGAYRVTGPFVLYKYKYKHLAADCYPTKNGQKVVYDYQKIGGPYSYKIGDVITPVYDKKYGGWVDSKNGADLDFAPQCYLTKIY
ncbi:MAG: hypothetical protein K6G47_07925 [Clostridia bacterium]|nr:hypothetical protein [Clostridia bacterium]